MASLSHSKLNFLLAGFFSALIFISCKRDAQFENQENIVSNKETADKVNTWLETQKTKASGDRPQRIQSLQQSLNLSKLRFEELYEGEKLIIVPINSGFQTENNKDKNPINCLLMILDKYRKIRKGNIVQYIPNRMGGIKEFRIDFFHDYYNLRPHDLDGTLTFLSVSDDLQHESKYENGSLISSSVVELKPKGSGSGKAAPTTSNLECYDVWWVTYYPGGGSTWEYLYSFCDDGGGGEQPCRGTINTNGRTYRIGCGGGGGGGGEDEVEIARYKEWNVYQAPPNNIWQIKSYEYIRGKRYYGSTSGGYFTNISHNSSTCNGMGILWGENSNTVSFTSLQASSNVSGIYLENGVTTHVANNASWAFSEVFP